MWLLGNQSANVAHKENDFDFYFWFLIEVTKFVQ